MSILIRARARCLFGLIAGLDLDTKEVIGIEVGVVECREDLLWGLLLHFFKAAVQVAERQSDFLSLGGSFLVEELETSVFSLAVFKTPARPQPCTSLSAVAQVPRDLGSGSFVDWKTWRPFQKICGNKNICPFCPLFGISR